MTQRLPRVFALFLSLVLVLGLAACTSQPTADSSASGGGQVDESTRVIVFYPGGAEPDYGEVNKMLHEYGFSISFVAHDVTSFSSRTAAATFVRDNFKDDAIILGGWGLMTDQWDDLLNEGIIGDFYGIGMETVPAFMERPQIERANKTGTMTHIPTNFREWDNSLGLLAVLVREDVAQEYGKEIRTGSEYVELLRWLKEKNPDKVPGAAYRDHNAYGSTPYSLFLPEMGYWDADGAEWLLYTIGSNEIIPLHEAPESRTAIEEYFQLWNERLLYLRTLNSNDEMAFEKFDNFPTVLAFDAAFDYPPWYGDFDASGYRMYTLYNNVLPVRSLGETIYWSSSYAAAGEGADITDFLSFMVWLGERENYRRFFYGVEGVDYELNDNGRVVSLDSGTDWEVIRQNLSYFERSDSMEVPVNAPFNYEQERAAISFAYTIVLSEEDSTLSPAYEEWKERNEITDLYSLFSADIRDMEWRIFSYPKPPSKVMVDMAINRFIAEREKKSDIINEYARLWEGFLAEAEIIQ